MATQQLVENWMQDSARLSSPNTRKSWGRMQQRLVGCAQQLAFDEGNEGTQSDYPAYNAKDDYVMQWLAGSEDEGSCNASDEEDDSSSISSGSSTTRRRRCVAAMPLDMPQLRR